METKRANRARYNNKGDVISRWLVRSDVKSPSKYVLLGDNRKRNNYPEENENACNLYTWSSSGFSPPIAFVHRYGAGVASFMDGSVRAATVEVLMTSYATNLLTCIFDPGEYQ